MQREPTPPWTPERLLELGRSYQSAAVFAAAADLEVFDALAAGNIAAEELNRKLRCDHRGLVILLDALVAIGLVRKKSGRYSLAPGAAASLTADGPRSILAMAQHQANCMRSWAQLARVVKTGQPAVREPSVRGAEGDAQAFIGAMHDVSAPQADKVVRSVRPLRFAHLLDVGGASGTWTLAFLRAWPEGRATLFDLPHVLPMARKRVAAAGLRDRVKFVAGDFMADPLPSGADLAWVSAIVHQNSRQQNRALFANLFQALAPGGRVAIRDILMDENRTQPAAGALFAINMLVATPAGGTFTFQELREDLEAAGFSDASVARSDPGMSSVIVAHRS